MSSGRIEALSRSLADSTSRRSLLKVLGVGAAGTAVTAVGLNTVGGPNEALAATIENQLTGLPVTASRGDVRFKGKLNIKRFKEENGKIVAVGKLTGKATRDDGRSERFSELVTAPVTVTSSEIQVMAICQVLNLKIGPIDLNLLGLRLQTNEIRIVLTADSEGGLLGSLLCGLAGGVDVLSLSQIIRLLNDILDELKGL